MWRRPSGLTRQDWVRLPWIEGIDLLAELLILLLQPSVAHRLVDNLNPHGIELYALTYEPSKLTCRQTGTSDWAIANYTVCLKQARQNSPWSFRNIAEHPEVRAVRSRAMYMMLRSSRQRCSDLPGTEHWPGLQA